MIYAGGVDLLFSETIIISTETTNFKFEINFKFTNFLRVFGRHWFIFLVYGSVDVILSEKKNFFHKNFIFISFADVTIFYWLF